MNETRVIAVSKDQINNIGAQYKPPVVEQQAVQAQVIEEQTTPGTPADLFANTFNANATPTAPVQEMPSSPVSPIAEVAPVVKTEPATVEGMVVVPIELLQELRSKTAAVNIATAQLDEVLDKMEMIKQEKTVDSSTIAVEPSVEKQPVMPEPIANMFDSFKPAETGNIFDISQPQQSQPMQKVA